MTKKKHLLDAAFPTTMGAGRCKDGMTLRDYFAGQALAGLIVIEISEKHETFAEVSYQLADAMLEARNQ